MGLRYRVVHKGESARCKSDSLVGLCVYSYIRFVPVRLSVYVLIQDFFV